MRALGYIAPQRWVCNTPFPASQHQGVAERAASSAGVGVALGSGRAMGGMSGEKASCCDSACKHDQGDNGHAVRQGRWDRRLGGRRAAEREAEEGTAAACWQAGEGRVNSRCRCYDGYRIGTRG